MIRGLRNKWETWREFEARNRAGTESAIRVVARMCPNSDLIAFEDMAMADYAAEVEAILDSTAAACGGSREDLEFTIRAGKILWREETWGILTAQCFGVTSVVPRAERKP
jgi:hypothetical protein